jgi:UDP-glucose:glycoprotein glucosyltransferase
MTFSDQPRIEPLCDHQCWDIHYTVPLSDAELFQMITNSFTLYARSLTRKIKVSEKVKEEVYDNWAKAAQGANFGSMGSFSTRTRAAWLAYLGGDLVEPRRLK